MSLWSWVQALTEAKEKGMGHAPTACEWDHPSSEWARGWGPYTRGHVGCLKTLNQWPDTSRGSILHFSLLILFLICTIQLPCFYQALKSKLNSPFLAFTVSHLYEENPSLCSTLEPLYCSSLTTAVEGI